MLQRWPPNILGKRIFRDSLVDYKRLKFYIHTENFLECSGRIPPSLRQISPNCILRRDLLTSYQNNFYIIRVLPSLSGCTVVAHIVSRDFIAFAASRPHRLHVDVHRRADGRVPQNLLNHLVGNPESVQIGREPAPECVPAVPSKISFL